MEHKLYFGTKDIKARPMKGPPSKDGADGQKEGYEVVYPDGYTSWSPKNTFELAYRENGQLSFGHAFEALNQGMRVRRAGWNGKDMWIYKWVSGLIHSDFELYELAGMPGTLTSMLLMKGANNELFPWTPNMMDLNGWDWEVHPDDLLEKVAFPIAIAYNNKVSRYIAYSPDFEFTITCGNSRNDISVYVDSHIKESCRRGYINEIPQNPVAPPDCFYKGETKVDGLSGEWISVVLQPQIIRRHLRPEGQPK